jgi:hypothetical protein
MADTFQPIGAVAVNVVAKCAKPLNPEFTFKNISVHVIHILARMMARDAIRAQLREEGVNALPFDHCRGRACARLSRLDG